MSAWVDGGPRWETWLVGSRGVWAGVLGKAPSRFSPGCCEIGVLGIFSFGLVSLDGFLGEPWHQFCRMGLHNVLSGQTDTGLSSDFLSFCANREPQISMLTY